MAELITLAQRPDVIRVTRGSVIQQQPELMRQEQAKADAIIDYARKVKDWPLLDEAVTAKIEDQREFVAWWKETVTGSRHNINPPENADRGFLARADAETLTGITQQQVSRWRIRLKDIEGYRQKLTGAAYRIAWGGVHNDGARGSRGTGEHEWFTPIVYIEAARLALGAIDLDPASHAYAQAYVRAEAFHTVEDDGLAQEWHGRVWLNPPYGREVIGLFVNKLIEELGNGRTTAAIMLTHNYTDTEWFHAAARYATALCFTLGRVKFVDSNGEPANPTQGQVFFYYGADTARFAENFARFGLIVNPAPGNTGWGRLSCGDAAGFSAPRRSASTTPASAGGG